MPAEPLDVKLERYTTTVHNFIKLRPGDQSIPDTAEELQSRLMGNLGKLDELPPMERREVEGLFSEKLMDQGIDYRRKVALLYALPQILDRFKGASPAVIRRLLRRFDKMDMGSLERFRDMDTETSQEDIIALIEGTGRLSDELIQRFREKGQDIVPEEAQFAWEPYTAMKGALLTRFSEDEDITNSFEENVAKKLAIEPILFEPGERRNQEYWQSFLAKLKDAFIWWIGKNRHMLAEKHMDFSGNVPAVDEGRMKETRRLIEVEGKSGGAAQVKFSEQGIPFMELLDLGQKELLLSHDINTIGDNLGEAADTSGYSKLMKAVQMKIMELFDETYDVEKAELGRFVDRVRETLAPLKRASEGFGELEREVEQKRRRKAELDEKTKTPFTSGFSERLQELDELKEQLPKKEQELEEKRGTLQDALENVMESINLSDRISDFRRALEKRSSLHSDLGKDGAYKVIKAITEQLPERMSQDNMRDVSQRLESASNKLLDTQEYNNLLRSATSAASASQRDISQQKLMRFALLDELGIPGLAERLVD